MQYWDIFQAVKYIHNKGFYGLILKRIHFSRELNLKILLKLIRILETNAAEIVILCLKLLSRMHNISIITSIFQPNSDVLMMFDKLFVLSKGEVCDYSGSSKDMKNHLNECQIFCTECQKPIEVIMKIACNESDDNHVIKLSQKA
jgi:ABC-type multidrug transport system ATPase subunit